MMNAEDLNHLIARADERRQESENGEEDEMIMSRWHEKEKPPHQLLRPIKMSAVGSDFLDRSVVTFSLYNSFNYSLFLSKEKEPEKLSIGITSPGYGEGKTTTVCNLAAALSTGAGRKTVIVDLNLGRPRIHEVFGIPMGPGLAEALLGNDICVVPTQLENLFALPVGDTRMVPLSKLHAFREILASLFNEFDFVIVDMPPAGTRGFPTLIANQLSGLLVVVRSRVTKRREIGRVLRKVREENVLGFVMNGVNENDV